MERTNFIGLDAHSRTCDVGWMTPTGKRRDVWHVRTSIPELTEAIERVPRPRKLAMEEGPMADWLMRQLKPLVDELVVCDPRRNALIGKDGDKTDTLDAFALADLFRGGHLRAVHHTESMDREVFKRHVALYHDRVEHRVAEANKMLGLLRRYAIVVVEDDLAEKERRQEAIAGLPDDPIVRLDLDLLLAGYDSAAEQARLARVALVKLARKRRKWAVPSVAGATPSVAGIIPSVAGATPSVAGATPSVAGIIPSVAGIIPSVAGATPSLAGLIHSLEGMDRSKAGIIRSTAGTIRSWAGTGCRSPGNVPGRSGSDRLDAASWSHGERTHR